MHTRNDAACTEWQDIFLQLVISPDFINRLAAKLFNWNSHPLEVVSR